MNLHTAKTKLVLLVIAFFLGTGAQAFADTLTYSHVDKATLSSAEQGAIQTGTPKGVVDGDARIVLVYEKDKSCTVAPGQKKGTLLPHTGEAATAYSLMGVALLGGVFLLVKKGKKKGTFLILVLATGAISTAALASTDVMITKDTVITYKSGEAIAVTPEAISCYKYIGYIVEKGKPTTTATSTSSSTSTSTSSTSSTSATTEASTTDMTTATVVAFSESTTPTETTKTIETSTELITPWAETNLP